MLNHTRTLLLNVNGSEPFLDVLGEELVDLSYRALTLPSYLNILRNCLFGASPDREMRNYRARQFLTILHSSSLAAYVTYLDPRISYDFTTAPFLKLAPIITQLSGSSNDQLLINGDPLPSDTLGQLHHQYTISVPTTDTIQIISVTPPTSKTVLNFDFDGSVSQLCSLPNSGYRCYLTTTNTSQQWRVDTYNRPENDLGVLTANVAALGQTITDQPFGLEALEPFSSCRNIWAMTTEVPLRLGAVLIALVYRMELIRRGANG